MEVREAVRGLLIESSLAVLLMRVVEPSSQIGRWITPGGAVEPGETLINALLRELYEELGAEFGVSEVGPAVWHRRVQYSWNDRRIDQHETFFVIPVERFHPPRCIDGDGEATLYIGEPKWWTSDELSRCQDPVSPPALASLLDGLDVRAGVDSPIDISGP